MILADKIIENRKKNGWSQEDLAYKLGVSRQSVSKWEGAQAVPDMKKIVMMAELFNVSTDYLLCLSDNPQPKKQGLNEEEKKLLDQYWQLNAKGRMALNLYIEFLISQENYTKKIASSVS